MKILNDSSTAVSRTPDHTRAPVASFAAMMGAEAPKNAPDRAVGFNALGVFGRRGPVAAPAGRPVAIRDQPDIARLADASATGEPDRPLSNRITARPAATGQSTPMPSLPKPEVRPLLAERQGMTADASIPAPPPTVGDIVSDGPDPRFAPPERHRRPRPPRPSPVDVRIEHTQDGSTVTIIGNASAGVIDRFRDAARTLLARHGQYLHRYLVNGDDRSSGRTEKGSPTWR